MKVDHQHQQMGDVPLPPVITRVSSSPFLPRASERRVLLIVGVCQTFSHLHILTSSHHIFKSSHLLILTCSHLHIFSSSHLLIFTSSHLHILTSSHLLIFTSSHLHITSSNPHVFSSSHPHIFTFSHLRIFWSSHPHILTSSHLHILTSSHLHSYQDPRLFAQQDLGEPSSLRKHGTAISTTPRTTKNTLTPSSFTCRLSRSHNAAQPPVDPPPPCTTSRLKCIGELS